VLESLRAEEKGDEGHVAGVHGLHREARGGAVEVGVGDEILDGLDDLFEEAPLNKPELQHRRSSAAFFFDGRVEVERGEISNFRVLLWVLEGNDLLPLQAFSLSGNDIDLNALRDSVKDANDHVCKRRKCPCRR